MGRAEEVLAPQQLHVASNLTLKEERKMSSSVGKYFVISFFLQSISVVPENPALKIEYTVSGTIFYHISMKL